eukprot:TRINITY_DN21231_c0_g1_i1.p1 TRINITY_DN21231_c0_g1~~TRINITY_DN21231_c0_g1_i1.p1  ORF type:complete len:189 (-),score=17.95 TRINITY_DN21231_c0_g1_i1:227-793(-)
MSALDPSRKGVLQQAAQRPQRDARGATGRHLQFHPVCPNGRGKSPLVPGTGPSASASTASLVPRASPALSFRSSPTAVPAAVGLANPSKVDTLGLTKLLADRSSRKPLLREPHLRFPYSSPIMSHTCRRYSLRGVHLLQPVREEAEGVATSIDATPKLAAAPKKKAIFACGGASRAISLLRSSIGFAS